MLESSFEDGMLETTFETMTEDFLKVLELLNTRGSLFQTDFIVSLSFNFMFAVKRVFIVE